MRSAAPTSCLRCAGLGQRARRATRRAPSSSPSWILTAMRPRCKPMADAGVIAFAMELMPRITRAQVDGRAVEPGQSRRLPRRDRRRRRIWPRAADDDDGGRHRAGQPRCSSWASASPACRRSRPRAGSAPSSPRPTCGPRPRSRSRASVRSSSRSRTRSSRTARDRRRLRQGNVEGVPGQAGRAGRRAHQEAGHRHHHRADPRPSGAAAGVQGDGRVDAARLGARRSRGRARRQRRRRQARRRSPKSAASRSSAISTCRGGSRPPRRASTPRTCLRFLEILIDKKTKTLAVNWDDEHRQGDRAHPRRRDRASEFQAEKRGLAQGGPWRHSISAARHLATAVDPRSAMCRPVRVPPLDFRAGGLRRLLRRVVGDAGAAHAADVGDQRHLLGDRRRRAACGRRRAGRRRYRYRSGRARSASSRSSSPRSISSAASWSPSACSACIQKKQEMSTDERRISPRCSIWSPASCSSWRCADCRSPSTEPARQSVRHDRHGDRRRHHARARIRRPISAPGRW